MTTTTKTTGKDAVTLTVTNKHTGQRDGLGDRALLNIIMIELGMYVEDMRGYLGMVAASPRGGKWLVLKDDGRTVRRSEHEIREYAPSLDRSPAYEKWLEKREFR